MSAAPIVLPRLLEEEPLEAAEPLDAVSAVYLVDWISDTSHGPTGEGPESPGAACALWVVGRYLRDEPEGRRALALVRDATAHETAAEKRAPSATMAIEAADALVVMRELAKKSRWGRNWLRTVLHTPVHARYALALLVERGDGTEEELFEMIADYLAAHEEAGAEDREYAEHLRARFGVPAREIAS